MQDSLVGQGAGSVTEAYHPTIWRTCRMLTNGCRLRCLRVVFEEPSSTVGEIAARAGLSECHASGHLRALQARGLIQARRQSRWVHYSAIADPLVPHAPQLLAALRRMLLAEDAKDAVLIRILTAFTHPRRLQVLQLLQEKGPLDAPTIAARTRISAPALSRHLSKLRVREVVADDGERWVLAPPPDPLTSTLLALLNLRKG